MTIQPAALEGGVAGAAAEGFEASLSISGAGSGGSSAVMPRGRELFSPKVAPFPPRPLPPHCHTATHMSAYKHQRAKIDLGTTEGVVLDCHWAAERDTSTELQDDLTQAQSMEWGTADRAHSSMAPLHESHTPLYGDASHSYTLYGKI